MSNNRWNKLVGVAGRLLLAFAFVFSQTGWAGQNQQTKDKPASPQKAAAQQTGEAQSVAKTSKAQSNQAQGEESESSVAVERPGDGAHQLIKVHGHWTIEVKNPDGSLVRHVEFENSLDPGYSYPVSTSISRNGIPYTVQVNGGSAYLAALLSGEAIAPPLWGIVLSGPAGLSDPYNATNAPCLNNVNKLAQCSIFQSSIGYATGPVASANLIVSPVGTAPAFTAIQLSGSVQVNQNGQISTVETRITSTCTNYGQSPCPLPGAVISTGSNPTQIASDYSFTSSTNFPGAPISVSSGQTVAVTVVISFS